MLASFRDLTAAFRSTTTSSPAAANGTRRSAAAPGPTPRPIADFRNNVVYNLSGATNLGNCRINVINNFYRPGPDKPAAQAARRQGRERGRDEGRSWRATSSRAGRR